jgi:hypothetical protein
MKLQRTTLVLLITATLLGGGVYFSEIQRAQNQEAAKTTKEPIFSFKEDQIESVTIYTKTETLEFERASGKGRTTNWQMKQPKEAPASDAAVAFLLDLLAEGKSDRSFFIPANQRQEYGLNQPLATVKVQLKNKENHRLSLGKPDFNRSFLYAQADSPQQTSGQLKVLLVPIDFDYAVNRPISEWQNQAERPKSPTPSPTPTNSKPSPTAETPTPSATPKSTKSSPTSVTPKPSSASPSPKPSASPEKSKPSSASPSPKPSASPEKSKPLSASPSPKPSASPEKAKPSSATPSPKPSASPEKSKPSSASPSLKPSASPEKSKPSSASPSPKPSASPEKPKP